jgi:integrase
MKKDGKSLTTVSMYLRALRTIINKAIDSGDFSSERKYYPFGKNKFKIPAPLQKKKTLTVDQLRKLINYKPKSKEKAFARDMFLFSYYSGGPNPVDIAKFRYEWIKGDHIHFPPRSKTENTNPNQDPIPPVPIDSELKKIIDKWKVGKPSPKSFVFGILSDKLDARQIVEKVNGFNKDINQGLKDIAKDDLKLKCVPTMGYARATQANNLMAAGVSVEEIARHMGHASPKTTKIYLKQLPDSLHNDTLSKLRLPKLKAV